MIFTDWREFDGRDTIIEIHGVSVGVVRKSDGRYLCVADGPGSFTEREKLRPDLLQRPGVNPFFLFTALVSGKPFRTSCQFITDLARWTRIQDVKIQSPAKVLIESYISIAAKDIRDVEFPIALGPNDLEAIRRYAATSGIF